MADKPIIFSAPMVRALLQGRKSQTRRVLNPQPLGIARAERIAPRSWRIFPWFDRCSVEFKAPSYAPGDRLYVREAFCPRLGYPAPIAKPHYRADDDRPEWRGLWKPSFHMPRWASRLTLNVTEVRVQRLQEISEADAVAEGCEHDSDGWRDYQFPATQCCGTSRDSYRTLWNSLHGPDAWDANPWVVALTFTVQRGNIDQIGSANA